VTGRRQQLALGVLVAAAVLAVAAYAFRATWWGGLILAVAEAGIVGGLADWFAVTALFRRPLGLPIPHTALIPANWELMARRVGAMVGTRVLTKDYVGGEIGRVDLAALLALGAARLTRGDLERAARAVLRFIVEQVPAPAPGAVGPRLHAVLAEWRLAPALAGVLETAREHGWDARVIEALAQALGEAFERVEFRAAVSDLVDDLLARYRERLRAYPRLLLGMADVLGLIDRARLVAALRAGVSEMTRDPAHPLRRELAQALGEFSARLRTDARVAARVEALKDELLASPVVGRLVGEAAAALRRSVAADLAAPASETVGWVVDRLERARRTVAGDAALRVSLDSWIKARAIELVERHHARVALFIENGVRALGAEGAVRLIEEQAGDDLQYIRVNGTVVGGLAGGVLYALHLLLRHFW
jgi:uncharacterized membrane-anchored protein YjiN (DUF445 family)